MRTALAALAVVVGFGCTPAAPPETPANSSALFERALVETPVADLLAARVIARMLARGCDGVVLHPFVEPRISGLRQIRPAEFAAITSTPVAAAGRRISNQFDVTHQRAFRLDTRRGKPSDALCAAVLSEARSNTLLGMMLVAT
ncbi:hypothetical protein [uncultured Sulfitobacter sp.]|uniref:hypothetical protein n=1 Tax=uncultured Sulfitobacter sp. TaxID=191468 RepID=UPI00262A14F3|nr:hypothetical protein [uncultured Sulfitobacter sp.]